MAVLPHLCGVPGPTEAAPGKYCAAAPSPLAHPQGTQEQQHCRAGRDSGSRPAAKLCCAVHVCSEYWTKAVLEIRTNVPYSACLCLDVVVALLSRQHGWNTSVQAKESGMG